MVVTKGWGWGAGEMCVTVQTGNEERSDAQHSDGSQQHCSINFEVAKKLNLNCSQH